MLSWSKNYKARGVRGADVVELLRQAINRVGVWKQLSKNIVYMIILFRLMVLEKKGKTVLKVSVVCESRRLMWMFWRWSMTQWEP